MLRFIILVVEGLKWEFIYQNLTLKSKSKKEAAVESFIARLKCKVKMV